MFNFLLYLMVGAVSCGVIAALYQSHSKGRMVLLVATVVAWPLTLPGIIAYKIAKRFAK